MNDEQLHQSVDLIGIRAQATAVGFVRLAVELRDAGVIDEAALGRVKDAMVCEISHTRPRSINRLQFETQTRSRLDRIFAGSEQVGPLPTIPG